jgi:disulfide oxidoreductase YuzD
LIAALLVYPQQVAQLIRKVAQKQINAVSKKGGYIGYQAQSWNDILKHEIFSQNIDESELDYPWVISNDERVKNSETKQRELAEETLTKLYSIYFSRSCSLFAPDHILL